MTDQKQPRTRTGRLSSGMYSSKIIKAGALIGDTKTLLSHWDVNATLDDNLHRIQRANFFGKASRSRVEDRLPLSCAIASASSKEGGGLSTAQVDRLSLIRHTS